MDHLTLQVVTGDPDNFDRDQQFVEILVTGRSIREIIRDVERPFAGKLAGSYGRLTPDYLPGELQNYGQAIWILGCTCGEPGCWPRRPDYETEVARLTSHP